MKNLRKPTVKWSIGQNCFVLFFLFFFANSDGLYGTTNPTVQDSILLPIKIHIYSGILKTD